MGVMDWLERAYDWLSAKSASILSLTFGVINFIWIYLFDKFANGKLNLPKPTSIDQWLIAANASLYALIILLILSVLFGIIGIKKALSGDRRWIILAVIGILLGLLPLIVYGYSGRIWFRTLYL
jgi:hypothetical protein